MRRRDAVFLWVAGGAFLAGLAWALSTQLRWAQENKPIQVQRPGAEPEAPEPPAPSATGVIGTVGDDTRTAMAMAKEQASRKPTKSVNDSRRTPSK